jgi:aryl-alcohol dehydrogenase-like predicted oxidoreductase
MDKRILGPGKLEVSALGFGCMGMSQSFGPNPGDRQQMIDLLRTASTAVSRSSTPLRSTAVRQRRARRRGPRARPGRGRHRTKFGFAFDEQGRQTGLSSRPEHIRQAVDGSLRRHGGDTKDLH